MSDLEPGRIGEFIRIVFARLWDEPAGLPAGEVLAHVAKATQLSDYESSFYPSTNTPRYEKIVRLATIPLVKAGWMVKGKGRWYLTDEGRQACRSFLGPADFYQRAVQLLDEWRQTHSAAALVTEEAEEQAWTQIRQYLLSTKAYEFQDLTGELLKAMGYHIAWIAPPGKDRGYINFIIYSDPLGVSLPRIKVHLQHSGQPALLEGFKSFLAVLGAEDAGLFISSGGFTGSVRDEARAQGAARVVLIDLESFFDLWVEYYDRLTQAARQRLPLKPLYFLSFME
jgi:restriction system protein